MTISTLHSLISMRSWLSSTSRAQTPQEDVARLERLLTRLDASASALRYYEGIKSEKKQ